MRLGISRRLVRMGYRGLVFVLLFGFGCGSPPPPERTAASDAAADTQALREANAAAGPVVRATGDCAAVKAAAPNALRELDEIAPRVRTGAGQMSLDLLRKQVQDAVNICP